MLTKVTPLQIPTLSHILGLLRQEYLKSEEKMKDGEAHLHSSNWDGDVYVGSRWNTLSILYLIFLLTPLVGLAFAWATYGSLWGRADFVPPAVTPFFVRKPWLGFAGYGALGPSVGCL